MLFVNAVILNHWIDQNGKNILIVKNTKEMDEVNMKIINVKYVIIGQYNHEIL
jgi:hypothetical protein